MDSQEVHWTRRVERASVVMAMNPHSPSSCSLLFPYRIALLSLPLGRRHRQEQWHMGEIMSRGSFLFGIFFNTLVKGAPNLQGEILFSIQNKTYKVSILCKPAPPALPPATQHKHMVC